MNIQQAQHIWNELTVIRGRTQMVRHRLTRPPAISLDLWKATIDRDMGEIEAATGRILVILAEMEREAGIGAAVSSEGR